MDLSRRYVCFFVFLGVFLLEKVLPCELSSGRRLECGTGSVSSSDQCPNTCCFNAGANPDCYFEENVYGPIQHSNGLCISVRDGSDTLFWSNDCTSRNAFFVVSYDHSPYHIASGKCVLPSGPPNLTKDRSQLTIRNDGTYCTTRTVAIFRPTENGTLEYHYIRYHGYYICIGGIGGSPKTNDYVYLSKKACQVENVCQDALSYVYQRKFVYARNERIRCYLGQTIKIIIITWANSTSKKTTCVSTKATQLMQGKCDGKTTCSFIIRKADLGSCSGDSNKFLVRYTCKVNDGCKPAAPNTLNVLVRGQKEVLVEWSNDASCANGVQIKFQICHSKSTGRVLCNRVSYSQSSPNKKLSGLRPMTKYDISIARYSCDGKTIGEARSKTVITRSVALKSVKKSASSFQIHLGSLEGDDKYIQIIVSKLRNDTKPIEHPGNDLLPYDVKTVDNQPYIAAQLDGTNINQNSIFTVGDGKKYAPSSTRKRRSTNYQNVQLEPETYYSVFQRTFQSADLYYDSDWMDVIKTDETPLTNVFVVTTEGTAITQPGGGPGDEKQNGGCSEGRGAGTEDCEKYLVGIIVLIILVIILLVILAYFIYQNRRLKSSKANSENRSKDRNNSKEIDENPDNDDANYEDANYEDVENEESTYTALKRPGPGEEENDVHLYAHLNEVHKDYVNQAETGF